MEGFVTIHRKIFEWEWYTDIVVKTFFIHCLLKANHTDKKWRGVKIKRGQFLTSLKSLSSETGLTIKQVRRAIDALVDTKELGKETTKINTLITVSYYDKYQSKGTVKAQKGHTEGQRKGKERATTNNDNNEEQVNNDNKYPTLTEVQNFFIENNYMKESATKAYNYYNDLGWVNSKGKEVKNWKSTMRNNWFKKENEALTHPQRFKIPL